MKQKYKVFINDKEILFQSDEHGNSPNSCLISLKELTPDFFNRVSIGEYAIYSEIIVKSEDPKSAFTEFIDRFRIIEAAGGLVINELRPEELLMIYRLGFWDLPKGKIDKGESVEAAALREVEEECGISELKILENFGETYHMYLLKGNPVIKKTYWYLMNSSDNRTPVPQLNEGIEEVRWISTNEFDRILPLSYRLIADLISEKYLNR